MHNQLNEHRRMLFQAYRRFLAADRAWQRVRRIRRGAQPQQREVLQRVRGCPDPAQPVVDQQQPL